MKTKQALILFTRDPLRESSHKRILNSVQDNIALYQNLIAHTMQVVNQALCQETFDIFSTSKSPTNLVDTSGIKGYITQRGHTFSRRLQNTIEEVFHRGYQQVVIIGNDCPDLSAQKLMLAFQQLRTHDVVLGPATDGGVYLIGVNRSQPDYFAGVNWYTESVYADLLRNIYRLHQSVYALDGLSDIDTLGMLNEWSRNTSSPIASIILQLLEQPEKIHHIFQVSPFNHKRHLSRRTWQKAPPLTV